MNNKIKKIYKIQKQRVYALIMTFCMVVGLVPMSCFTAYAAGGIVTVRTLSELQEALDDTDISIINIAANIDIPASTENEKSNTAVLTADRDLTIQGKDGTAYTLKRTGDSSGKNDSILEIWGNGSYDGVNVTIRNLVFDGGAVWSSGNPGIRTNSGVSGRAIIDVANKGTLNIEDGVIIQNGKCTWNEQTRGGESGDSGSGKYGAGIRVEYDVTKGGGTVNLKSGSIIRNCDSEDWGGAIGAYNFARLNVYGGTIENCYSAHGGAICCTYRAHTDQTKSSTIKMYGGLIKNCYAETGGGFYADGQGTVSYVNGGTFENCVASQKGSAIAACETVTLNMASNPTLSISGCTSGTNNFTGGSHTGIYKDATATINIITPKKITFNTNGGSEFTPLHVTTGNSLGEAFPGAPTKDGYEFGGWYTDNGIYSNSFTKDTIITEDITVYAKWTAVIPATSGFQTMNVSGGYNADIVATSTDNTSTEYYKSTASMDSANLVIGNSSDACLYSKTANSTTGYLPDNGIINSTLTSNLKWQMASYTDNNALKLGNGQNGELTFSTVGVYKKIYFLATAGGLGTGHSASLSTTIYYTDGTSSTSQFTIYDWWDNQSVATKIYRRLAGGSVDGDTTGAPYFTQCSMDVETSKLISSIKMSNATNGMFICVFGITGETAAIKTPKSSEASNVTSNSFTANWEYNSDADSYVLDVATDENFTNFTSYNNTNVGNKTLQNVSGLDEGKTYYYRVRAVNSEGQSISSDVKTVNLVDTVDPTATITIGENEWNNFDSNVDYNVFYNSNKVANVVATDSGSGVKSVEYLVSDTKFDSKSEITGTWTTLSTTGGNINVNTNSKQFIYVKVIDNRDNESIINTDGIIIYTEPTLIDNNPIDFVKNSTVDKTKQITLNGNTIKEIKNGDDTIDTTNYTVASDGTITFKNAYLNSLAADDYELSVIYKPMGVEYCNENDNDEPEPIVINLNTSKAVSINNDISKTYSGSSVSAPSYTKLSTGTEVIEYKVKDADDSTYTTTAPTNAGDYTVRISIPANGDYSAVNETKDFSIEQKEVTINGVAIEGTKEYDGTSNAVITNNGTLSDNYDGSNLSFTAGTASYADNNVGDDKVVTFTGFALNGSAKNNYKLTSQPTSTSADITSKALTVNASVKDKLYDGSNNAEFNGTPELVGVITGDTVQLTSGVPSFTSVSAADDIAINFTAFSVSGADAANYTLTQPTGITASINEYIVTKDTEYSVNSNNWLNSDFVITAEDGYKLSETNTVDGTWTDTLTASDNTANGTLEFYVKNTSTGAISKMISEDYKIDKTAPTATISIGSNNWNEFLNTISFGLLFNETQTVTITPDNDLSGIAKVEYISSETELSLNDVKARTDWIEGRSVEVTAVDSKQFIYYARVTDNAGNVSYFSTDGAKFDTTDPVIEGITDGATYYTTQIATINSTDIKSITLNGETVSSPVTLNGNTTKTYKIVVTDNANNVVTYTVEMKTIDNLVSTINSITEANVKSTDKTNIQTVKTNLGDIISTNATAEEKEALNNLNNKCNALLTKINSVTEAITTNEINKISSVTNEGVKLTDKSTLETAKADIEDAITKFAGNYTQEEMSELFDQLNTVNLALSGIENTEKVISTISSLPDVSEIKASDKDAIKAAKEAYDSLTTAEKEILGSEYAEKLNAALEKLENIENTQESTKKSDSPKTGDTSDMYLWIALLFVSGALTSTLEINRRNKKHVTK